MAGPIQLVPIEIFRSLSKFLGAMAPSWAKKHCQKYARDRRVVSQIENKRAQPTPSTIKLISLN
uniref:Uncharacterized protein n=1 Tax=Romanomermis culicivorax TaxID=13658 RepID=A0A915HZ57_ROMCU